METHLRPSGLRLIPIRFLLYYYNSYYITPLLFQRRGVISEFDCKLANMSQFYDFTPVVESLDK